MTYVLMTDETNSTEEGDVKFFIYGGLAISIEKLPALTKGIEALRDKYDYGPTDPLKFNTVERPDHIGAAEHRAIKDEVLDLCAETEAKFLSYVILHKIAKGGTQDLIGFAVNTILSVFNFRFLAEHGDRGIVVVDRLPYDAGFEHLKQKFCVGLELEGDTQRRLTRIDLFAASCDGASHLSSAVDIVLGAFRFCVNHEGQSQAPAVMFPKVVKLMYGQHHEGDFYVGERGLTMRPKGEVRVPEYRAEYEALRTKLTDLGRDSGEPDA